MSADLRSERLFQIIRAPRVSEKAALNMQRGQYVFRVAKDATRPEVRRAVEQLFKVSVHSVQLLNVPGKRVQTRQIPGRRRAWKKAYVRLMPGQQLDLERKLEIS